MESLLATIRQLADQVAKLEIALQESCDEAEADLDQIVRRKIR